MSTKYPGGFITKSPVAPTTTAASGIWTLDQQQQAQKAGTWPSPPIFIEDLFSTYLYTGTGTTNNIVNGIDLAGKGGLVWTKARTTTSAFTFAHALMDTARGAGIQICSDRTDANTTQADSLTAFNSNGYTLGADTGQARVNNTSYGTQTYVGWTFAKQSKFFDVVTYTGNGSARTIAHNLGSVPGCIIVKCTSVGYNWMIYHSSLANTQYLNLNNTNPVDTDANLWNSTTPTSSVFSVGASLPTNQNGATYVAYLFAHNAGGFPASGAGSTNGISCGSYTGNGSTTGPVVTLGYEPQWLMIKNASAASEWVILDNMRGIVTDGVDPRLFPNTSGAENTGDFQCKVNATGFQPESISGIVNQSGSTYIYIAIRRGPMKTPTVGTSVFNPAVQTPAGFPTYTVLNSSSGFPVDMLIYKARNNVETPYLTNRLTNNYLQTASTAAEASYTYGYDLMQGVNGQFSGTPQVSYAMRRAPGFFDVVCYTGTEVSGQTFTHNLGVVPEMMIVKSRSGSADWTVYHSALGASARIYLNATNAANTGTAAPWNSTTPTSSVFSLGNAGATNLSGATFINYLFATVAGVSKVGSYTGTGALQTINCGFTSGSRFVLIKRTDSTGDWWTYDSARGITAGDDPYLYLNSTAAEVTNTNYVDTDTTGFKVTAAAPAGLNANGGTYIFLAIA